MNVNFKINGKEIETKRLILRPFKQQDLEDFYEYAKVEGVGDWSTAYENGEIDQWNSEVASALTQELIADLVKTLFDFNG